MSDEVLEHEMAMFYEIREECRINSDMTEAEKEADREGDLEAFFQENYGVSAIEYERQQLEQEAHSQAVKDQSQDMSNDNDYER